MAGLEDSAAAVKDALDAYVALLVSSPADLSRLFAAADDLQGTVRAFAEASVDTTGWGNPFVPATEFDERPPGDEDDASGVVHVEAQYVVRVVDREALGRLAAGISGPDCYVDLGDEDRPAAEIHDLFARDGWDPYRYEGDGLQVVEAKWQVYEGASR